MFYKKFATVLGVLLFLASSLSHAADEKKAPSFADRCKVIISALTISEIYTPDNKNVLLNATYQLLTSDGGFSKENLEFLLRKIKDYHAFKSIPPSWAPLATAPEHVIPNLLSEDGHAMYEVLSLLWHLSTAQKVDANGKLVPHAIASQNFLEQFCKMGAAYCSTEKVSNVIQFIVEQQKEWPNENPYKAETTPAKSLSLSEQERLATALSPYLWQGEQGIRALDLMLEHVLDSGILPKDWHNFLAVRPKRTPHLLAEGINSSFSVFETLGVLRMIHMAKKHKDQDVRDYAKEWLDELFTRQAKVVDYVIESPQTNASVINNWKNAKKILEAMEKIYKEATPQKPLLN